MRSSSRTIVAAALALAGPAAAAPAPSTTPAKTAPYPSEIPATFTPTLDGFDHVRRTAEIPMRDGVKLHTVMLIPKGTRGAPMMLDRTPYNAEKSTTRTNSVHVGMTVDGRAQFVELVTDGGYILVIQDIRGKYGSEGDYVMNRPLRGPQNPTAVDHATDTFDTIDWLVKNVPESNGKVGVIGVSYDGFTALMATVDPHPALKVAVPINPMVDGWRGDDWFHNGAFRQLMLGYFYGQGATRKGEEEWPSVAYDDYDLFMAAGSAGALARRYGLEQSGFWRKVVAHPAYDAFWRDQAVDLELAKRPLAVPMLLVHSLWDQEDIYGAPAVYRALEPKDTANDKLFFVVGPWRHHGIREEGRKLGPIEFDSATARTFRREVLRPFLDQYLKDGAPPSGVAPMTAFVSGVNQWRRLDAWPSGCARCTIAPTRFYLGAGGRGGFTAPAAGVDEYVSDPAKPVTHMPRPVVEFHGGDEWDDWLVTDQRQAAARPDVLVYTSDVLTAPVELSGPPRVNLVASTTGTDADWVVKLIDVYPPEVPGQHELGGYQLPIAMDIFRGRYRESLAVARPIAAGKALPYTFALPETSHVFRPGHRIMVQVQSSWFPLYDRNPQTFVPSIFDASPGDYRKATHRVHRGAKGSYVELPIVTAP